jgi:hypothetical protein
MMIRSVSSRAGVWVAGASLMAMAALPAAAQENSPIQSGLRKAVQNASAITVSAAAEPQAAPAAAKPNAGNITFTSNFDILPGTAYVFRGITQESDPELTMWPSGDVGFALHSADTGGVRTVSVNTGLWNSLHTGSSGLDGPNEKLHYEEDYYASFTLGFNHGVNLVTTYTAYTSPNGMFGTTHEVAFKVTPTYRYGPYAVLAQEMSGGADGGPNEGTYLELGLAGPSWGLSGGKFSVAIPVKLGLSLNDYYEHPITGEDHAFGFFDIGALVTIPISRLSSSYGSWNFHFGGDILWFGDTTKYFNDDESTKGVFLFGIGFTY